jgi:hypothetical protein
MRANSFNCVSIVCAIALTAISPVTASAQEDSDTNVFDKPPSPTLLILNGRVWTGVPGAPEVEALAITGNTITAIGTTAEIKPLASEHTLVIEAAGRRIIPGITDSHTHFIEMGLQLARVDLRTAANRQEFIDRVAAQAARMTPGEWMLGGQYTVDSWEDTSPPQRSWIDAVTPGNPVFLNRMDGHQALANSVALKYARIDKNGPPDPPGGEIVRDPQTGEPTGILKDEAMSLVTRHIPPIEKRKMYDALLMACQVANAWGITAVHDMTDLPQLPVYLMADERGTLTVRVRSYVQTEAFQETWPKIREQLPDRTNLFEVAGLKSYVDGSLGSRTAYMREPFADNTPDTKYPHGFLLEHASDLAQYAADIRWAHDHGIQMAVHAIGDQANHELLDIFAQLPDGAARRHRIEHAQHLLGEDIPRFAKLGVIASLQPLHKADDGRWAEAVIGPQRARTSYAFADLLKSSALLAFGSDTPVVTMNPYLGIHAAVTATTLAGEPWVPEQRISREQALHAYTVAPHVAAHREDRFGALRPGMIADIAILDRDILNIPINQIEHAEAAVTIVDGRVVFRAATAQ